MAPLPSSINMKKYQNAEAYLSTISIPYKLSGDKAEVMIQCLFCDDKKTHLYVSNENGCWLCHRCGARGSWYNLLEHLGETERVSLEAISNVQHTAEIVTDAPKLQKTMEDVEEYHLNLIDRIFEYLKSDERGLNAETLEDFKVGWDGKSIVFPVFDKEGNLVNIRHRRDPVRSTGPKMWNETGGKAAIFNIKALQEPKDFVILCEGEFDCMIACQYGFPGVTGTAGANTFKPEWVDEFKNIEKVYICYDSDEAGREGALNAARYLKERAYIVKLPKGDNGEKIDITDFFCSLKKSKEDFQKLISASEPYVVEETARNVQGFKIDFSDLTKVKITSETYIYIIKPVRGKTDLSLYLGTKLVNRDVFSLNSAKARTTFINSAKSLNKEQKIVLGNELVQLTEVMEQVNKEIIDDQKQAEKVELSDEEMTGAKELLRNPKLVYKILKAIKKLGVAGEEKTALIHYLILSSGKTDDPLSIVVKGESSVGKSYVVQQVLKLFPKDSYIDITDATAQSFYYAPEDHFAHKIIIIFEKHGGEKADYSIRSLQSEKKLKIQVTVKDPESGQFITKEKEVNGPVGFITTTTDASIHQENETRNMSVYPDETSDQTSRTFEMTDAKYRGVLAINNDFLAKWVNVQRVVEPLPVLIPFVEEIRERFPKKPVRVRRDYGKLLAIISVIALIHQEQRNKIEVGETVYIEANLADFYIAKVLLEETLQKTIYSLSPKSESLIAAAKGIPEATTGGFNIRTLADEVGWDYDTAHKWFKPAFKKGYFKKMEDHSGSKAAIYTIVDKKIPSQQILPSVKELYEIEPKWLGDMQPYNPITGETVDIAQLEEESIVVEDEDSSTDVPTEAEQTLNTLDDAIDLFNSVDIYKTGSNDSGTSEQSNKLGDTP